MAATESPSSAEVKTAREAVQAAREIGITAAQDLCAEQVHTTRRVWQQWESGDRRMHPAFWELFRIKSRSLCVPDDLAVHRKIRMPEF